jgi:sec-independent protein translocase protein TatA|tara:strand:+ start:194 stop:502 length:309 start_codon:yes stop_codon:yes gene_type:complete
MVGSLGSTELIIILVFFFILFGAERLPKMARSIGQSKGEFHKGLKEVTESPRDTQADLEAGGRTPEQALAERARSVGIDPTGMDTKTLKAKVEALEALGSEE